MLNIPNNLLDLIKQKKNVLIVGVGDGFDVYGGIPIYYTLQKMGINVHLANYSFSPFDEILISSEPQIINKDLIGANATLKVPMTYYPEGYLAEWMKIVYKKDIPIWTFNKVGVKPLRANYKHLIDLLKIDLIILLDGGADSLNTGREEGSGNILAESINLAALNTIQDIEKIIVCVGFGTEVEEKVCGYNVLMSMSNIIKNNGFYGSCSLTKNMESYKFYKSACTYVFNKENHPTSHIHRRIIPAAEGEFGDFHSTDEDRPGMELFISPLMSIFWFFNLSVAASFNMVIPYVNESVTYYEAVQDALPFITNTNLFPRKYIPY